MLVEKGEKKGRWQAKTDRLNEEAWESYWAVSRVINVDTDRQTDTYRFVHLTSSTSLFRLIVESFVCVLIKLFGIPSGKTKTDIYRGGNIGVIMQLLMVSMKS